MQEAATGRKKKELPDTTMNHPDHWQINGDGDSREKHTPFATHPQLSIIGSANGGSREWNGQLLA